MPRRKSAFISDVSDSDDSLSQGSDDAQNSQEDEDSRAERNLFEHNGKKRRKMGGRGGKEAAWEGIFGGEDDNARQGGAPGLGARRKAGFSKPTSIAPKFVSKSTATFAQQPDVDRDSLSSDEDTSDESDGGSTRSARIKQSDEDEEEEPSSSRPGIGGASFKRHMVAATEIHVPEESNGVKSSGRGGIGSASRAGIGSAFRASGESSTIMASLPSSAGIRTKEETIDHTGSVSASSRPVLAFGRTARQTSPANGHRNQQAFKGREVPVTAPKPMNLTAREAAHFQNIGGSYGARLLKNLGWNAGEGLGKTRSGRAVPIEVGKVFKGQGLMSGMRTEDSKREAKRRGEIVSDEEDKKPASQNRKTRRSHHPQTPESSDHNWRKQKKLKVKVEHKTYEQVLAEAGESSSAGIGLVLDARGGELKEVSSLSALSLSNWTPSSDAAQLPELRHNLRLIVDVAKADVDALARDGKSVKTKRDWALQEDRLASEKMLDCNRRLSRLESCADLISHISVIAGQQVAQNQPSLELLRHDFDTLLHDFHQEYVSLNLDEIIVGAIGQVMRSAFLEWKPFDVSSDILLSALKPWRHAYRLSSSRDANGSVSPSEHRNTPATDDRNMTAWEGLLWTLWLPRVRSAINNDWSASSPQEAVHLLESWDPVLPPCIRDNILDQLVLPKVKWAMEDWNGRASNSQSLAGILFPWLPLLGHRMEEILDSAKRRIRLVLRKWTTRDGLPEELTQWRKSVFSSKEWDDLMLRNVVPKLGACLRDDFVINPRKQDTKPLEDCVLPWHRLLRASTFSQLLEVNFFPKWLDILYIWLIQPNYKADEVANWFTWWKGRFPQAVLDMQGVARGFTTGLELMRTATELGPQKASQLRKPVFEPLSSAPKGSPAPATQVPSRRLEPQTADITFRSLAEEIAAQNDLLFLPLGRSHDVTGRPLFKVCKGVDGKGGITLYVGEEAVFAQAEDGLFRMISLDEMLKRGSAR